MQSSKLKNNDNEKSRDIHKCNSFSSIQTSTIQRLPQVWIWKQGTMRSGRWSMELMAWLEKLQSWSNRPLKIIELRKTRTERKLVVRKEISGSTATTVVEEFQLGFVGKFSGATTEKIAVFVA